LLAAAVEAALERESMPPAVLQKMLNLADFMELHLQPLPIPVRKLGSLAERCQAYAKAAHYREMSFTHAAFRHAAVTQAPPGRDMGWTHAPGPRTAAAAGGGGGGGGGGAVGAGASGASAAAAAAAEEATATAADIESLISINNQLQLPEAAAGVLAFSRDLGVEPRVSWYEKLGRWSDALAAYDRMSQSAEGGAAGGSIAVRLGSMRCLHALGEWRRLCQLASEAWLDPALDASGGESTLTPAPGSLHPS